MRYRTRLVAKGFTQRNSSLRYLFALSVQLDMNIAHLNVTTAFLNGHLKETMFMLPNCFAIVDCNKILKLEKAIYGLEQGSLAWYDKSK